MSISDWNEKGRLDYKIAFSLLIFLVILCFILVVVRERTISRFFSAIGLVINLWTLAKEVYT